MLNRIDLAGGQQGEVTLGEAAGMARWPEYLPDGSLLFQTRHADPERRGIYVMRPGSGQPRRLVGSDWAGHYGSEHLLFLNGSTLMAQPFDPSSGTLKDTAHVLANEVGGSSTAYASFSVSSNGVLAYTAGLSSQGELRWMDRTGSRRRRPG